jgi:peptidoglycan hydrolase CwlO-like protein
MTNEEIQRVMEFIIKRQESFAEGMEQLRDSHAQSEKRISQLETAAVHLFNANTDLNKAHKALADRMAELAEAQAHTDRRVNALIDLIEDQRRNGRSQS